MHQLIRQAIPEYPAFLPSTFSLADVTRNLLLILLISLTPSTWGAEKYLVKAYPKVCKQALYMQPTGGPFSVFLFCDDALGSNIGVINVAGGAGPGNIPLSEPKTWSHWDVNDRFWQVADWATDVTSFAWSPDLRFLYVATSEIYGTGALYRLDLTNRTYEKLEPPETHIDVEHGHTTEIIGINRKTGDISVALDVYRESSQATEIEIFRVVPIDTQLHKWVPIKLTNPSINTDTAR